MIKPNYLQRVGVNCRKCLPRLARQTDSVQEVKVFYKFLGKFCKFPQLSKIKFFCKDIKLHFFDFSLFVFRSQSFDMRNNPNNRYIIRSGRNPHCSTYYDCSRVLRLQSNCKLFLNYNISILYEFCNMDYDWERCLRVTSRHNVPNVTKNRTRYVSKHNKTVQQQDRR